MDRGKISHIPYTLHGVVVAENPTQLQNFFCIDFQSLIHFLNNSLANFDISYIYESDSQIEKFKPSGTINLNGKCISLSWFKVFDCFYMEVVSVEASSFGSPHHKFPAAICMNQPCQGVHVCICFELQSSAWTLGRGNHNAYGLEPDSLSLNVRHSSFSRQNLLLLSKAIPLEYSLVVWGAISEKACKSVDKKHRPCSCGIRRRWFLHKWINIKQYPILPSAIDRLFKQIRVQEVNIARLDKTPLAVESICTLGV